MSVESPAAPPRLGRTARWLIGLGVAAVLAVTSFTFLIIGLAGLNWTDEAGSETTVTATAAVLDVDMYQDDYSGDGSITVDVDFTYQGEHEVTSMEWPPSREAPDEGDRVRVRFDPADPEYTVELDDQQAGDEGSAGTGSETVAYRTASATDDESPVRASGRNEFIWAWWVAAGCALGAVVTVVATAVWASRAPAPPRPPVYGGRFPPNLPPYLPQAAPPAQGGYPPPS